MNTVIILGRTTADIELKYTNTGKSVTQFTLAVQKNFKKDEANFIPVVFWGQQAEALSKYVKKGQQIAVQGELTSRKYEVDGKQRIAYEVVGSNFSFCGTKNNSNSNNTTDGKEAAQFESIGYSEVGADEDLPF